MRIWAALLFILLPTLTNASSIGLRCGNSWVQPGDFAAYVLKQCGEPEARQIISGAAGADSPLVEQWVYNLGSRKQLRVLTFIGGRLQRIEDGGRRR